MIDAYRIGLIIINKWRLPIMRLFLSNNRGLIVYLTFSYGIITFTKHRSNRQTPSLYIPLLIFLYSHYFPLSSSFLLPPLPVFFVPHVHLLFLTRDWLDRVVLREGTWWVRDALTLPWLGWRNTFNYMVYISSHTFLLHYIFPLVWVMVRLFSHWW